MTTSFQNEMIDHLLHEQCEVQITLNELKMCNDQNLTERKQEKKKNFRKI